MVWIPMTAKDRFDTKSTAGFATHPFIQYFAKGYPASYASAHCPTVVHKRYY
jgi:hypothetical protein